MFIVLELILFYFIIKKKQFRILNFFFLMFFVTQVSFDLIPKEKFNGSDFLKNLDYEFNDSIDRILSGIDLFKENKAPLLILTNGKLPWSIGIPEGEYLKNFSYLNQM